ncbi:hypothetical protein PENTCL1PPCAC_10059, partial [Pristionchus entomophagus]
QLQASLAIVEGWRRKFFYPSNDVLHSAMLKGYDSAAVILSPTSNHNRIQLALRTLDSERKISMEYEDSNADPIRLMTYGFMESVHLVLLHLTEKNHSLQAHIDSLNAQIARNVPKSVVEQETQTDQISVELLVNDMIKLEEEMINDNMEHPMHIENARDIDQSPYSIANSVDAESTIPRFTKPFPKQIK